MKNMKGHLLFRIFITYLVTALLIVGVLFSAAKILKPEKGGIPPFLISHILNYTEIIQSQWGIPIDQNLKNQFAEKFQMQIHCQGDAAWGNENINRRHQVRGLSWGDSENYFFLINENLKTQCLWQIEKRKLPPLMFFPIFSAVAFILFILLMSFLSIQWMMRPVQYLLSGASRLAEGDLKYRMPEARGVLRLITQNFNQIANRLETLVNSKEILLRDVSHELKSPLARMSVAVSLLPENELKNQLKNDIRTMDLLTQEILKSYQYQSGQIQMIKSHFLIGELLEEMISYYQNENIRIKVNANSQLKVNLDRLQIEKVFRNLIENAIHYNHQPIKLIEITAKMLQNDFQITVSDNGIGIAKENLNKIFEPFFQVDGWRTPGQPNIGLGLSIVQGIVRAHGGTIQVESQFGQGTQFILRFPQ